MNPQKIKPCKCKWIREHVTGCHETDIICEFLQKEEK